MVPKKARLQEKMQVRRLKEIVECEQKNSCSEHEHLFDQHMTSVRSVGRRLDTTERKVAAVEERLQAVYARRSSFDQQVGERPECLREWFMSELKVVDAEIAQTCGSQFEDLIKKFGFIRTEKDEPLNVCLRVLYVLAGALPMPLRLFLFDCLSIWALSKLFLLMRTPDCLLGSRL